VAVTDDSRAGLERFWGAQLKWWHLTFAVLWVITLVITFIEPAGRGGHVATAGLLVVMAIAYAVWAPSALLDQSWKGWAYLAVAWSALIAIHVLDPNTEAWLLFFVLFPHLWVMLSQPAAVVATIAAVASTTATRLWGAGGSTDDLVPVLVTAVISIALSILLGIFTSRMVHEASRRAETIDALHAAQAELAAAERDRGVSEERERLSREIHDTLAQGFTSVLTLTRAAEAALGRGDIDTARARLSLVEQTASENLDEARLIVAELSPGHLQSRTLVEALERLTHTLRESGGVQAHLRVNGDPVPLGGAKEVVLLRTAQECLSNVRRHSGAATVDLALMYAPGSVNLHVVDDGTGFDADDQRWGFGLDGLRARVGEVGGTFEVSSALGKGTRVSVEVPR